jgi:hypothetical protein
MLIARSSAGARDGVRLAASMKSPYRISAKEPDVEPRFAETRSYAVLICIALGVIVQLVGLLTHGLDAFGHVAFAFAFGLGTAGLQASSKSPRPEDERDRQRSDPDG